MQCTAWGRWTRRESTHGTSFCTSVQLMVQCSSVVFKQTVKECHACAERMFLTIFRTLQITPFNINHLPTHTLDKNLPLIYDKPNSAQLKFLLSALCKATIAFNPFLLYPLSSKQLTQQYKILNKPTICLPDIFTYYHCSNK
jgi:hypothetical protein